MKRGQDRCEHCGRWVDECSLVTLLNLAKGHAEEESCAVCERCWPKYDADYWYNWLEKRCLKTTNTR